MNLKQFGRNSIIYWVGTIGLKASALLLIPLYTTYLSIEEYGLLATLLLTIQIMIIFMGLGTRIGFVRFLPEYESKGLTRYLFGSSILMNLAGGLAVAVVSIIFLVPLFRRVLHTDEVLGYLALTCGAAICQCLCLHILSYYRANNEALKYIMTSGSSLVVLLISNMLFVLVWGAGVKGALLAHIITYGGLCVYVIINVSRKSGVGISTAVILKLLWFGLPLVLVMSGDLITDASAIYFLSYFGSLKDVAILSLGYKIAQVAVIAFISPFQLAYEPFVFANIYTPGIRKTISKLLTYLVLGFSFVAFGIVFMARDLLDIIAPPQYSAAYLVVFLILPGIGFRGVYYIGESLINVKTKTYITGTVVTALTALSVFLNYLLIPVYGRYGAIIVFNFTIISSAVLLMIFGMKLFQVPLERKRLALSGALLAFFLGFVFILREARAQIFYSLIPLGGLGIGMLLYMGGFFDLKEKDTIRGLFSRMSWGLID